MEKWMVVLVAAGFLIPYGTVLAVTGNIHGAEYVRQQEKEAAGKYRILLDREENGGYLSLEEYLPSVLAAQISPDREMEALKAQAVILRSSCVAGGHLEETVLENGTTGAAQESISQNSVSAVEPQIIDSNSGFSYLDKAQR